MKEYSIRVDNLSKVYKVYNVPMDRIKEALNPKRKNYHKDFYALNGVSFDVQKGETLGIVGKNGSGKSTLLKVITGVLSPTTGNVVANGKVSALLELGAGFNPEYTGIENVYTQGTLMGYTKLQIEEKLKDILEFADIGEFATQPVKVYSSGMFARLAFATAINVEPEILIVDEALAVGDVAFQKKCIDKMKEIRENGTTILFVSHALEQVKRFCTRAIWIKDGVVEMDGNVTHTVDAFANYLNREIGIIKKIELKAPTVSNNDLLEILDLEINREVYETGDYFECTIDYHVNKKIEDLLVGVAIHTVDGKYVFGPNTALDKFEIPNEKGKYGITYKIPCLNLLSGEYIIDVGFFTDKGLVCIAYINEVKHFVVQSEYISEGLVYLEHSWEVQ